MSKFNAGKASVLVLTAVFAFVLFLFSGQSVMAVNFNTPSTNDINRTNGWAHVDATPGVGEAVFNFIQPRAFFACFEYRTDGNTSQMTSPTNYNTSITDGLYPYFCLDNRGNTSVMTRIETVTASGYVEVRMVFGAERDERFDWTRFNVDPAPDVCGNLKDNQATLPDGMQVDVDNEDFCSCKEGYHEVNPDGQAVTEDGLDNFSCVADSTPTPTPTSTTTTTSNDGGDGLGCATHDCSGNANKAPQGQVLGASTMAGTGSFAENLYLAIMAIGGIITFQGVKNYKKAFKLAK